MTVGGEQVANHAPHIDTNVTALSDYDAVTTLTLSWVMELHYS